MPLVGRKTPGKVIALDTETTGVDHFHGSMPFFVTIATEGNTCPDYWEWNVNPLTRQPQVPPEDVTAIQKVINSASIVVGQNFKFDAHALSTIGISVPWEKVRDTLVAGHLLATNHPHNLTDMLLEYCGVNIEPLEERLRDACTAARRMVRAKKNAQLFKGWRIAEEGLPEMPSAKSSKGEKDKLWKNDMWLPRAIAVRLDNTDDPMPDDHPWRTVLSDYSNADSVGTLLLWNVMKREVATR